MVHVRLVQQGHSALPMALPVRHADQAPALLHRVRSVHHATQARMLQQLVPQSVSPAPLEAISQTLALRLVQIVQQAGANVVLTSMRNDGRRFVRDILGAFQALQVDASVPQGSATSYPYLLRTVPTSEAYTSAFFAYILYFGWRGAGMLGTSGQDISLFRGAFDPRVQACSLTSFQLGFAVIDERDLLYARDGGTVAAAWGRFFAAGFRLVALMFRHVGAVQSSYLQALAAGGFAAPQFQLMHLFPVEVAVEASLMSGHYGVHALSIHLTTDESTSLVQSMWQQLTPEEVATHLSDNMYCAGELVGQSEARLTSELFTPDGVLRPCILTLFASFNLVLNAMNDMLNHGWSRRDVRGIPLKEYMLNATFSGFGYDIGFDEQADRPPQLAIQYMEKTPGEAVVDWVPFLLWTDTQDCEGKLSRTEVVEDTEPPLWATGARTWSLPEVMRLCPPGVQATFSGTGFGGAPGVTVMLCEPCPPGTFSDKFGDGACEACPAGTFSIANGTACEACRPGSSAAAQSTICSPCDPGTYASATRSSECIACTPGSHQPNLGASSCADCPTGTISRVPAAVECKECPAGFFKNTTGSSSECDRCVPGRYSDEAMASQCMECSFGTTLYGSSDSRAWCTCPAGTFFYVDGEVPGRGPDEVPESARCIPCNEHMVPCLGGRTPNSAHQRPGFHVSPDGTRVYQCASQEACLGGPLGGCPEHSEGPGCATCHAGSSWDGDRCRACTAKDWSMLLLLPIGAIIVYLIAYRVANDPIGHSISSTSEFIVLVGLSISVIFFFNCFAALEVQWKEPILSLVKFSRDVSSELGYFSLSCSAGWGPVVSMALSASLPFGAACIIWVSAWLKIGSAKKLFNTFAGMIYACFLLLVLHGLKPFRFLVHPLGSGKSLLFMPSIFEGSPDHMKLMLIGIAVVVVYCIPFLAACLWASVSIIRCGQPSRRRRFLTSFRFLFYKFRPHAFYWGVVILLRNMVFALAPSLWPEEPVMAVFVLCIMSVTSVAAIGWMKPWRATWMSAVDIGIMIFVTLTLTMAVDWIPGRLASSNDKLVVFMTLVAAMAIGAACMFILVLLARMVCSGHAYRERIRKQFQSEIEAIEEMLLDFHHDPNQEVATALSSLMEEMNSSRMSEPSEVVLPEALRRLSKRTCDVDGAVMAIVRQIRNKDYTLLDFHEDCVHAFPELELYAPTESIEDDRTLNPSAATTGQVERLRTMGALFAVYWVCRLDIDGREGLSFGVHPNNLRQVRSTSTTKEELIDSSWGKMSPEFRRAHLFHNFDWAALERLFQQAGITKVSPDGSTSVDDRPDGRLVAMLCLTAFHDIMKNPGLCPTLMEEYDGYKSGEVILDHDIALAYVLDRYPRILPSYRELSEEQRRAIRFTQGDLGFNAGWLVQAEGPPAAVLSKLKKATVRGGAKDADVAFYFSHWVTDLAGAEPTPFKGTEKFAVKFPPTVLQGLLGCFSSVRSLAHSTETEVYESYILERWMASDTILGFAPEGRERTAKMRLNCMAQQAAKPLLDAFDELDDLDQETLIFELAATGLPSQTFSEWASCKQEVPSSAFLLYYGPAWCQRVGESQPLFCLQVLATIFRLARKAFSFQVREVTPNTDFEEQQLHRTVHVGQLKTISLQAFEAAFRRSPTCMQVVTDNSREATLHISIMAL
mmetsp:Transcript_48214/g.114653  ORF Transcript_48214/g.114653 Transcript_48214/m.114653 type:complete len:1662 (-) Transcript_48214:40-5025(-)